MQTIFLAILYVPNEVYLIRNCICVNVHNAVKTHMSDSDVAEAGAQLATLTVDALSNPPKLTREYGSVDGVNCTEQNDALRLSLATTRASPGEWCIFQNGPASLVMPNRCFRQQIELRDGLLMTVFSGCVTSLEDIADIKMWTRVELDDVSLWIDQYSARVALDGVVVTRWIPDGMGEEDGFAGICMNFVDQESGEVLPPKRISELASAKREEAHLACNGVRKGIEKMRAEDD